MLLKGPARSVDAVWRHLSGGDDSPLVLQQSQPPSQVMGIKRDLAVVKQRLEQQAVVHGKRVAVLSARAERTITDATCGQVEGVCTAGDEKQRLRCPSLRFCNLVMCG